MGFSLRSCHRLCEFVSECSCWRSISNESWIDVDMPTVDTRDARWVLATTSDGELAQAFIVSPELQEWTRLGLLGGGNKAARKHICQSMAVKRRVQFEFIYVTRQSTR